jgi:hypothetical protein
MGKITRAKWAGGVAQSIEYLLCKCKALSSNPTPTKKKKGEVQAHSGPIASLS